MKLYFNGEELTFENVPESAWHDGRIQVRTENGMETGIAVRQGDTILVSFRGAQYKFDTKRSRAGASGGAANGVATAPMPGQIVDILVQVGETVVKGKKLVVLEAMKTQQPYLAPFDGVIEELPVTKGQQVSEGQLMIRVKPLSEA